MLERLNEYKLVENVEKRKIKRNEIEFLAFIIFNNSVKPKTVRSQGITSYARSKSKKAVQRFLGLINYDKMFIKDLNIIAAPLYKIVGKETVFSLVEEQ